jgi:hypothetical protein
MNNIEIYVKLISLVKDMQEYLKQFLNKETLKMRVIELYKKRQITKNQLYKMYYFADIGTLTDELIRANIEAKIFQSQITEATNIDKDGNFVKMEKKPNGEIDIKTGKMKGE